MDPHVDLCIRHAHISLLYGVTINIHLKVLSVLSTKLLKKANILKNDDICLHQSLVNTSHLLTQKSCDRGSVNILTHRPKSSQQCISDALVSCYYQIKDTLHRPFKTMFMLFGTDCNFKATLYFLIIVSW